MFSVQASYSYIITTHMSAHAQKQITHLANIFFPQFWWLLLWSFPNLPSFFRPQIINPEQGLKDGNEVSLKLNMPRRQDPIVKFLLGFHLIGSDHWIAYPIHRPKTFPVTFGPQTETFFLLKSNPTLDDALLGAIQAQGRRNHLRPYLKVNLQQLIRITQTNKVRIPVFLTHPIHVFEQNS